MLAAVSRRCPEPQGRFPRVTHPCAAPRRKRALDLHVLGAPPAFVLSQDQTLSFIPAPSWHSKDQNQARSTPTGTPRPPQDPPTKMPKRTATPPPGHPLTRQPTMRMNIVPWALPSETTKPTRQTHRPGGDKRGYKDHPSPTQGPLAKNSAIAAQDLAGEVERAADQDVVGRRLGGDDGLPRHPPTEPATAARAPISAAVAAEAAGSRPKRLAGDRDEAQARRQRQQRCEELRRDPWWRACRPPDAAPGRRAGSAGSRPAPAPAAGLWPPSSQIAVAGRDGRDQRPGRQPLQARRPARLAQAAADRRAVEIGLARAAAPPPPRARHCRSGGCRPAPAAAARAGVRAPRPRGRPWSPGRPSRGPCSSRGAPISAARASITASASGAAPRSPPARRA